MAISTTTKKIKLNIFSSLIFWVFMCVLTLSILSMMISVPKPEYLCVFVLGYMFSAIELGSRYKDEPLIVVSSFPGTVYLIVNALVCCGGLYLIRVFDLQIGIDISDSQTKQLAQVSIDILQAALSTFFIMRSSFLQLGKGSSQVDLGLNQLLKQLIDILDRQVDRAQAKARSSDVTIALAEVHYDDVYKKLVPFSFKVMQNVTDEESKEINQEVENIYTIRDKDEISKKFEIGLVVYGLVGRTLFESIIVDLKLRERYRENPENIQADDDAVLNNIRARAIREDDEQNKL